MAEERLVQVEGITASRVDEPLQPRDVRSVYLITYSQANLDAVPTREHFANLILEGFQKTDTNAKVSVIQWVCSREAHRSGDFHYHMAVKLSARRRWLKVRNYLDEKHSVKVNFSSRHNNYYTAWQYTTKEDSEFLQSDKHPDLASVGEPSTSRASAARRCSTTDTSTGKSKKRRRAKSLSIFQVSQIAVKKGIKTRLELMALANDHKKEGKTDLAEFIANRGTKSVEEALTVGWEMEGAKAELERSRLSRIEKLYMRLDEECVSGCGGQWLIMARGLLARNTINGTDFAEAVRTLLEKGRGKYRNIFIKGPANCGKTFILNPLNTVYKTFTNPATTTFAWVGAEAAEVLFLNDFRWSRQIIPWHDMLLLLEGQTVHLPAPNTHYSRDIDFTGDTPVFCTGKDKLVLVQGGTADARETEMMRVRWRVFSFHSAITESEQLSVPSCPRCFAELILPQS